MKNSRDEHRTGQSETLPPFGGAAALRAMKAGSNECRREQVR